jgi:hypothetical protein
MNPFVFEKPSELAIDGSGIFDLKLFFNLIDCVFIPIDISRATALQIDVESELLNLSLLNGEDDEGYGDV